MILDERWEEPNKEHYTFISDKHLGNIYYFTSCILGFLRIYNACSQHFPIRLNFLLKLKLLPLKC